MLGVIINDVFLVCVVGVVCCYLECCGFFFIDVMVVMMLFVVILVVECVYFGNYLLVDYVWLCVDIVDLFEWLYVIYFVVEVIKQYFVQIKDVDVGVVVELLLECFILGLVCVNVCIKGCFDIFKNVVVFNVLGLCELWYFGCWCVDQWFFIGQIFYGVMFNMIVWSYCDQFNLCVMVDVVVVWNIWELFGGFCVLYEELFVVVCV